MPGGIYDTRSQEEHYDVIKPNVSPIIKYLILYCCLSVTVFSIPTNLSCCFYFKYKMHL